jgi:hypothetical protein
LEAVLKMLFLLLWSVGAFELWFLNKGKINKNIIEGKGKSTWPFSAQHQRISAFHPPPPPCWLSPQKRKGGGQKVRKAEHCGNMIHSFTRTLQTVKLFLLLSRTHSKLECSWVRLEHRHKRIHWLVIGTARLPCFGLSNYVTGYCLAVVPQSGAKQKFYYTVNT